MSAVHALQTAEASPNHGPIRSLARLWAAGTGGAVFLVSLVYQVAIDVGGPLVVNGAGEVTVANVLVFTLLAGTIGAALAYVVGRFARRPRLTFLTATLIALAGYAVVPFTAAESLASAIWLNIFHVVVAIPVIAMLTRYLPKDRAPTEA